MGHLLLSRFQGVFLAARLGQDLEVAMQRLPPSAIWAAWGWGGRSPRLPSAPSPGWMDVALAGTTLLIHSGNWDLANPSVTTLPVFNALNQVRSASSHPPTSAELAIATLPVLLFFHEDGAMLRQHLHTTLERWQCPITAEPEVLAVAWVMAASLQDQSVPDILSSLLAQVRSLEQRTDNFLPILECLSALLQQRAGLQSAVSQLLSGQENRDGGAIALALYCFLSTPEDFGLCVGRAIHANSGMAGLVALTAALSAANTGITGLPLDWQPMQREPVFPSGQPGETLADLAGRLLAVWAGVVQPTAEIANHPTIAPAGSFRPGEYH